MLSEESTTTQLSRAMAGLARIGSYYKRHGCLPTFHAIDSPQAKKQLHKTVYQPTITCGICGLLFVGPISVRCQCKVQTQNKGRTQETEVA